MMICVSIAEKTAPNCLKKIKNIDFAEIRLDALERLNIKDIEKIFKGHPNLIATLRREHIDISEETRKNYLIVAIRAGAAFVDVELETDQKFKSEILAEAAATGCKAIISYHNFEQTPPLTQLNKLLLDARECGGSFIKIACKANHHKDTARLLGLLAKSRQNELIVTAMGKKGKISRIAAPLLGSPFTYASSFPGEETAPGQFALNDMNQIMEIMDEKRDDDAGCDGQTDTAQ